LKSNQFKLSLVLLLGGYFYAFASDNHTPFDKDEVVLSPENVKTIRFLKNKRVEIEFLGKLKNTAELYLDGDKVSVRQGEFRATLNLSPLQEVYQFKIKRPGISESVYPLKIRFVKDVPLPLRVKIEASQTKPISKEKVFTGTFPSRDWIQMTWLEATEKLDPAYLEKMEEEKQKLARLEEERVLNEKADQERALKLKEEAAFVEQERMREMQEKLARLEQERLYREKQEKERLEELEKDKLEAERVAKEQEAERLAEETLEKERVLASQTEKSNEMIEMRQYREPLGLSLQQGLAAFSLDQTNVKLSSLNWMVNASYQKKVTERMTVAAFGQSYIVPLTVSGATKGPNVIKTGADLTYELKDSSGAEWTPAIGLGYQTMVTSELFGYRDLFGPRVGISLKLPLGPMQSICSSLGMSVFQTSDNILFLGNNEFHFKTALEWKVASSFLSSLSVGADFSTLNLLISGKKLSSSGYSLFFGLNF
jgi:hypothetical protein